MKEKFYLTYPSSLVKEPILYLLGKKFDIVTNIRGANISNDMGLLALEIEGPQGEIDRAITWLRDQGITVEPIEKNVIEWSMLSDEQVERYSRQIILPQVGGKGQEKLLHARVFVSAFGPLYTSTLHYLAAAGVGTLGVFSQSQDSLLTSFAPPQEQNPFHIFTRLNPDCTVRLHADEEVRTSQQLVQSYDLVLSDSDVLHDACYVERRPFLYASVLENEACLMTYRGYEPDAPCLRCAQPKLAQSSSGPSLFSEIVFLFMGAHLATEAIKQLLNFLPSSRVRLLRFRFLDFYSTEEIVKKSADCLLCRSSRFWTFLDFAVPALKSVE
jgi:molybdopterin-synthase adenylyltransferase